MKQKKIRVRIRFSEDSDVGLELGGETLTIRADMLWIFKRMWACAKLSAAKNQDYSKRDAWYSNFSGGGLKGIINRMSDKFDRLVNLVRRQDGKGAVDEAFEDTC